MQVAFRRCACMNTMTMHYYPVYPPTAVAAGLDGAPITAPRLSPNYCEQHLMGQLERAV